MEILRFLPLVIALILMGYIFYIGFTPRGRSKVMKRMMKNQMDMMKDMTSGEMGERLKDLSKTAINVKKSILEENEDALKEMTEMEADIKAGAIKKKATAVKEGFMEENTMFCKNCGAVIDADSKFCKKCGKEQ